MENCDTFSAYQAMVSYPGSKFKEHHRCGRVQFFLNQFLPEVPMEQHFNEALCGCCRGVVSYRSWDDGTTDLHARCPLCGRWNYDDTRLGK